MGQEKQTCPIFVSQVLLLVEKLWAFTLQFRLFPSEFVVFIYIV